MLDLSELIRTRHSSRVPYYPNEPISKEDITKILEAGSWAPTAHNMQNFEIVFVDDQKILQSIEHLKSSISIDFIKENYNQLSFSEEELKRKKVGVLGTMFPKSWTTPGLTAEEIAAAELKEEASSHDERHQQFQSCPALMLILYDPKRRAPASEGDFLGIMSLGCVMENMWLMAQSLGIAFHVVSSLSSPSSEKEIKKMLNIPDNLMIAISFRLGYPVHPAKYLRVRRDVPDFTHHNKYGAKGI